MALDGIGRFREVQGSSDSKPEFTTRKLSELNPSEIGDMLRTRSKSTDLEDKAPVIGRDLSGLLDKLKGFAGVTKQEPTEKQKAARQKLDEKQSSTGVTYKDAKAVISNLTEKYKNDPSCKSKFESEQPKNTAQYIMPYEGFDPYKIPEPDRSAYFEALASVNEIEKNNSALLAQGGLSRTAQPSTNYAGSHDVLY